jgi:4-amino-4-deoxy-L-arabinose transferase-like glycosyltransferase
VSEGDFSAIEWRGASHWKRALVGVSLGLALLAAATAPIAPLLDPDEGYYPATAAETLRTGPFWDLRFNDAPRWDKPILAYGLIEASFLAFGESAASARLPSAIEGALLLLIVGTSVMRVAGTRAGALCSLVVGSSVAFSIFARVAHPEIGVVLSVTTTDLLAFLWLTESDGSRRRRLALAIGVSLAYGVLAKGPVAVALPALAFLAAAPFVWPSVDVRRLTRQAALAIAIAVALAAPWYVAMSLRHGASFLYESLWLQNVGRYSAASYGHRASSLSLVLPTSIGLLPWTGLLPAALRRLRRRPQSRKELLRLYMFLSAVTALVFYSLSRSKLPSYTFACIPPLAVVVGLWLDEAFVERDHERAPWRGVCALLGLCAAVLVAAPFVAGAWLTPQQLLGGLRPGTSDMRTLLAPLMLPLGGLLAGATLIVARANSVRWRVSALAIAGAVAPALLLVSARPTLLSMYPYEMFGTQIASRSGPVWLLARRAPSLTFYASRPVVSVADETALDTEMARARCGWLVMTREEWRGLAATNAMRCGPSEVSAEGGRMVLVWVGGSVPDHTLPPCPAAAITTTALSQARFGHP